MDELHLFAGAGGGILGSRLLGHRVIGAVEINEYCCRVLEQRQRDGMLERFPIFQTDIRDFIRHGYAELYKGRCDIVSGGFPCQPFSSSGALLGEDDPRNMWPATIECIRIIRPRFAFLENVPNLLTFSYFGTILSDLAKAGYDARWCVLPACALGAPHTRERLFILAYTESDRGQRREQCENGRKSAAQRETCERGKYRIAPTGSLQASVWDTPESTVLRIPDGLGAKVDRLRAIGNGQIPVVVRAAWRLLSEGLI